jgi:hypothetical protein
MLYTKVIIFKINKHNKLKRGLVMKNLESLKLFKDLQLVSTKYTTLKLKDTEEELQDNKKLKSLLEFHKSNLDNIKEKSNFVLEQTMYELRNESSENINKILIDLNNFAYDKYLFIKNSAIDIESTTVNAVMFSTVDELILINRSIEKKEYLEDKNTYFYIYEKILINSFMTFLALKDMDIENEKRNNLSQAILSQIKTLSIISM